MIDSFPVWQILLAIASLTFALQYKWTWSIALLDRYTLQWDRCAFCLGGILGAAVWSGHAIIHLSHLGLFALLVSCVVWTLCSAGASFAFSVLFHGWGKVK